MPRGGQKHKRPSKGARDRQRRRVKEAANEAVPELQAAPAVLDESVPPTVPLPAVKLPSPLTAVPEPPSPTRPLPWVLKEALPGLPGTVDPRKHNYLANCTYSATRHPGYFSNSGPTRASGYSPNSLIQPPVQELPPPATGFVCAPLPPLKLASGSIDPCPTSTRRSNSVFQGPVVTTTSPIAGPSGLYNCLVPHTPEGPLPPTPGKWYQHTAPPTTSEGFAVSAAASSSGDTRSLAADGTPESFSSSLTSSLTSSPPKKGRVDQPSSYPRRNLGL
ncbi:proline-rich receptor-like protein kinase PERK2 [Belonocnema kinseyi]|uniref:proline-rich receptor-like protein kinase PERK2 n=1 Tax=Belonocnema kinseyi TaxID=2817044 RepID=UPI00143CDE45|nr:proline-rich receptor-like protein kinase PERK2 [Belonocnema kinseyi]